MKECDRKLDKKIDNSEQVYSDILTREIFELYGAFPAKYDYASKYLMVGHEICRIHIKMADYRNSYAVIKKCVDKFPDNPFVLSKMGRHCLEIGRSTEAMMYFEKVKTYLSDHSLLEVEEP